MVFSSLIFLFAYLTALMTVYFIVPKSWRMFVLFVFSLLFYGWEEPKFIIVMAISMISAYFFGFPIAKYRETNRKKAKLCLTISLLINLAFLAFFKYANFFIGTINKIPLFSGLSEISWLVFPIGISFYTFQIMSYSIDIYRGDARLQKNFVAFGTYVTLFPQLVAGPIVRYKDIDEQLTSREENVDKFADGVKRFIAGMGKKILFADTCGLIVTRYDTTLSENPTVIGAWLIVICYTLQIYFDFSGYSDMAIGLGKMFGFEFCENFNYPYMSASITEFWRRWHISLSTWFKEYVYIPLGGNRNGKLKQLRNIIIVWMLTGFWHGASWNFVLWGCYFGLLLIFEKLFLLKLLNKIPAVFRHIYALFFIAIGWLIFYFTDVSCGFTCFKLMLGIGATGNYAVAVYDILRLLPFLAVCIIASTPLPRALFKKLESKSTVFAYIVPILTAVLFVVCIAYMVDSTYSPFLYTHT